MKAEDVLKRLVELGDASIAEHSQRFFKTGPGEYGEGDIFLGIRVPVLRKEAKAYKDISQSELLKILKSEYHEARLLALLIMVLKFQKGNEDEKERWVQIYLKHTKYINNWDLVDSSSHQIVGAYFLKKDSSTILELAQSKLFWERRIAMIAMYHYIKNDQFDLTLKLSEMLLKDKEDLMHKAVGWMLRELGKKI